MGADVVIKPLRNNNVGIFLIKAPSSKKNFDKKYLRKTVGRLLISGKDDLAEVYMKISSFANKCYNAALKIKH